MPGGHPEFLIGGAKLFCERQSTCARGSELVNHMIDGWAGIVMYMEE